MRHPEISCRSRVRGYSGYDLRSRRRRVPQLSCKLDVCKASVQVSHSSIGPCLGFGPDLRPQTSWLPRHAALHYEADGRMISVTAARHNLFQPNCANLSLDPWDIFVVSSILLWIVLDGVCFHREPMHQRIHRLGRHAPKSRNQVKLRAATTLGLRRSRRLLGHRDAALSGWFGLHSGA